MNPIHAKLKNRTKLSSFFSGKKGNSTLGFFVVFGDRRKTLLIADLYSTLGSATKHLLATQQSANGPVQDENERKRVSG